MQDEPYFLINTTEFLAVIPHLKGRQVELVIRLVGAAERSGQWRLPNNSEQLRLIGKIRKRDWPRVSPAVLALFDVEGDYLVPSPRLFRLEAH